MIVIQRYTNNRNRHSAAFEIYAGCTRLLPRFTANMEDIVDRPDKLHIVCDLNNILVGEISDVFKDNSYEHLWIWMCGSGEEPGVCELRQISIDGSHMELTKM